MNASELRRRGTRTCPGKGLLRRFAPVSVSKESVKVRARAR